MRIAEQKVIDWLLEENNPPVRYLTLTNLLQMKSSAPLVYRAHDLLMSYSVTKSILKQHHKFYMTNEDAYRKYTGLYWQIIFLGHFLADGHDPQISSFIEKLLQDHKWISSQGGQCLTANMLTAFMNLGYAEHPVVISQVESLAQRYLTDGGILCTAMDYSILKHCYMTLPKLLLCFSHRCGPARSEVISRAIELIVNEMISHSVYKYVPKNKKQWNRILQSTPHKTQIEKGKTVKSWIAGQRERFIGQYGPGQYMAKPGWLKFGFPLHYNSDVLEAMYALARSGTKMHTSLQESMQIILSKKNDQGKWTLENSLNGKMLADVEEQGKPSKWITYFALYVLSHFYDLK